MHRFNKLFLGLFAALMLTEGKAFASGSGMPWEGPLNQILDSFTGPVAKVIGVLAVVLCGLGLAFGEGGGGMKKGLQIVFGLAIAFSAASFGLSFFGFAGGVAF